MRKNLFLIFICFLFLSCSTGLKSGWGNFTAYYNTYYNAKNSYQEGYEKVKNSKVSYNPQQPIRIHEVPINAGIQDFDKAIEKGAEILRKHGDSKWVDNSLNLIGKSYFFKKEYFSADQKFQELVVTTQDESLVQESILWRSRVLLEMELYGQGIQYILESLENLEGKWNSKKQADLRTILAEYYVMQGNWLDAITQLNQALPNLNSDRLQERGYFLLGQLNEREGQYREAYQAFSTVEKYYHDYNLQYLALRKKAETARILGDDKTALDTFSKMVKDDKNTEFKSELDYEIAKTYQNKEDLKEAENIYKKIINNSIDQPSKEIKALSYYGLAEIYRFGYNDFEMAAAYYDTSSKQNASLQKLPESFDATELAISFGEYAKLKNEIHHKDSLLWVSNLSKPAFDSLLAKIKREKVKEIEDARKDQEAQRNTLVNITNNSENNSSSQSNGFLNVNNPTQQDNLRSQFQAIWGGRPLTDNWRVRELIRSAGTSNNSENTEGNTVVNNTQVSTIDASIDLSEVPFTEERKVEVKNEIANLKYELGNLFFISLNMPDSAAIYFRDIIRNHENSEEIAVAYYSLSEILSARGDVEEARKVATNLAEKFPGSRYTLRLAEKFDFELAADTNLVDLSLSEQYYYLKNDTSLTLIEFADRSSELALENVKETEAAPILFNAIQSYIRIAKKDSVYLKNYTSYIDSLISWKEEKVEFEKRKKEARTQIQDTSLSDIQRSEFQELIDSTFSEPDIRELFPYYGEHWEKSRININLFMLNFRNSKLISQVRALKQELEKPIEEEVVPIDNQEAEIAPESTMNLCSELEGVPKIRGGLESFLAKVGDIESEVNEVLYELSITQRGIVDSFSIISELEDQELVKAFNKAVSNELTFEPVLSNGEAVEVQCVFKFPIR